MIEEEVVRIEALYRPKPPSLCMEEELDDLLNDFQAYML